jgi:hypothetical protein
MAAREWLFLVDRCSLGVWGSPCVNTTEKRILQRCCASCTLAANLILLAAAWSGVWSVRIRARDRATLSLQVLQLGNRIALQPPDFIDKILR